MPFLPPEGLFETRFEGKDMIYFYTQVLETYKCTYVHRGKTEPQKAKWILNRKEEFREFHSSYNRDYNINTPQHYWAVSSSLNKIVGIHKGVNCRICKFEEGSNKEFHGYPWTAKRASSTAPSDILLSKWIADGLISTAQAKAISRKEL